MCNVYTNINEWMTRYVYICLGTNLYVYIGICAQFVHPYRKATEERKRKQKHKPEERRTGVKRIILFCSILVDAKAKKKREEENKKQNQNHSGKQHYNNKEWEWEWREWEREIKRNVDSTQQVIFRISFSRAIYIISANIAEDAMIVFSVPVCVRTCICVCFLSISFTSLLLSHSQQVIPNFWFLVIWQSTNCVDER